MTFCYLKDYKDRNSEKRKKKGEQRHAFGGGNRRRSAVEDPEALATSVFKTTSISCVVRIGTPPLTTDPEESVVAESREGISIWKVMLHRAPMCVSVITIFFR